MRCFWSLYLRFLPFIFVCLKIKFYDREFIIKKNEFGSKVTIYKNMNESAFSGDIIIQLWRSNLSSNVKKEQQTGKNIGKTSIEETDGDCSNEIKISGK